MKAIRVHAYGAPEQLIYEDVAEPLPNAGEVIVDVRAMGVNPADYKFRGGVLASVAKLKMPFIPGMDIAGTIAAVGEGVAGFKVGDRVVAMLYMMGNGGYAERVAVPAGWCGHLPAALDYTMAAALPTPGLTSVQWIEDDLRAAKGDRILVLGAAGACGLIACFAAKEAGAHVTAAVKSSQIDRVRYADEILAIDKDPTPPTGSYDKIADTIGGPTADRFLSSLKPQGVLSTIGTNPLQNPEKLDVELRRFGNHADGTRLARIAAAVSEGRLEVEPPRLMPLREASKAHTLMEAGGAGKIVLVP